jgi:hypothetical protein
MAWTLIVRNRLDTATLRTVTSADTPDANTGASAITEAPTTFSGPYKAGTAMGNPQELRFRGVNASLGIEVGHIVQYLEDDVPLFWGPIEQCPELGSPGAGPDDENEDELNLFVALGGEKLLEDSVVKWAFFDRWLQSVPAVYSDIVREACILYKHPALKVLSANFETGGGDVKYAYKPFKDLKQVLTEFADAANYIYFVDPTGQIHFRLP